MLAFLVGISVLFSSIVLHFLCWRLFRPSNPTFLYAKFMLVSFFGIALGWIGFDPAHAADFVLATLMVLALQSAYLMSINGIESESPSSLILLAVAKSGSEGVSRDSLQHVLSDELLVINRIEKLQMDGHIAKTDKHRLVITKQGLTFLRFFQRYQQLTARNIETG